ncbi:hypothetical protein ACJX0J_010936 [Zea mays]
MRGLRTASCTFEEKNTNVFLYVYMGTWPHLVIHLREQGEEKHRKVIKQYVAGNEVIFVSVKDREASTTRLYEEITTISLASFVLRMRKAHGCMNLSTYEVIQYSPLHVIERISKGTFEYTYNKLPQTFLLKEEHPQSLLIL